MLVDKFFDVVFAILGWLMGLLPEMPPELGLSSTILDGVGFLDTWIDVSLIAQAFLGVLGCVSALLIWSAINWVINKVRGSG